MRRLLSPDDESHGAPVTTAVSPAEVVFDPAGPWRRARSVALRPEPFGALVYHFGNRKLSFLKSKTLVAVVEALAEHPSASATLAACGVTEAQRPAYEKALADLARSQMIERRTPIPSPLAGSGRASDRGHTDPEAPR